MTRPAEQEHIAYRYLAASANVIPLQTRDKRPFIHILEGGTWAPYQKRRTQPDDVATWIKNGAENWGVVCGQVSGLHGHGLYCGDVDDMAFARWVLDHARDPIMRGACIVESGSGKAHIWFRSPNPLYTGVWWLTNRAAHAGDVRGDGRGTAGPSYMVVPPSIHPSGRPYQIRVGSFDTLPDVPNGEAFLKGIGDAYLAEHSVPGGQAPRSNSRDILLLSDAEKIDVLSKIRSLPLKQSIKDTLLSPGNQAAGTRHWSNANSNSEVDYAVICELIRKDCDFDLIERIFAASELGGMTYRDKSRSNHGYGYLKLTFDRARDKVEQGRAAARVASGANFTVKAAARLIIGPGESAYILLVSTTTNTGTEEMVKVEVSDIELLDERKFITACSTRAFWVPKFQPGQRGHNFADFAASVMGMVEDVIRAPLEASETGFIARLAWEKIRNMKDRPMPDTRVETSGLGWRTGATYYLRFGTLVMYLKGQMGTLKPRTVLQALGEIGSCETILHHYPNGEQETLACFTLRQQEVHLMSPRALPPPSV